MFNKEYVKKAMRTNTDINPTRKLLNASLGLSGESSEILEQYTTKQEKYNKEEIIEELGDLCWYIALAIDTYGIELPARPVPEHRGVMTALISLMVRIGSYNDLVKKSVFQGHEMPVETLVEGLGKIYAIIIMIARTLGYEEEYVLTKNIEKLKERYPEGFSTERSIKRVR